MPAFLAPLLAWGAKQFAAAWLTPVIGIIVAIAKFGGAIIEAVAEIVKAMAKSPEGRVMLAAIALGVGFLVLRYHYIEQGRAQAAPIEFRKGYAKGQEAKQCPTAPVRTKAK